MALFDLPEMSVQDDDKPHDLTMKMAMATISQRPKILSDGVNYTGLNLSGVLFLGDGMSITTATSPNMDGSLDGESVKAGTFLPIEFTQIQVSGGTAVGFVYSA